MNRHSARTRMAVLCLIAGQALAARSVFAEANRWTAAPGDESSVPVRKITLYRSGVGFFERAGDVTGDATLELRFKTEQINDIIKSMVLLDKGGRVESVSYGSKEPLARRLASFGVNINENPSIPDLLNRLRGASLKVSAGGESVSGAIMGVEQRRVPGGPNQPAYDAPFLNLLTATGVRSVAVADIASFELLDQDLAAELNKALAALAEYRADRSKSVQVRFSGKGVSGPRPVIVGYVHEMPVWKTSYRLVLPEDPGRLIQPGEPGRGAGGGAPGAGKPAPRSFNLQGWAIVENNTDDDWTDVRMALVSGQPVSFQMDLYEPLYVSRPFIPVPTIPGVSPRAYSGGIDATLGLALQTVSPAPASARRIADRDDMLSLGERMKDVNKTVNAVGGVVGDSAVAFNRSYAGISTGDLSDYAAAARAAGGEVGEVFQYELDTPVTIERQRSAMIPILNAGVSGSRVSIFNIADRSEHPMRGVELTNDSDLQLLPGPLAVFDSSAGKSAYAGDAVIGHISPGETRLLAYAVDLEVDVQTRQENTSNILKLRIVRGALEQTVKSVTTQTYAFKNKDQSRARTMVVEHLKGDAAWQLVTPKAPDDQTQTHYRFKVQVEPGQTVALPVVGERIDHQSVGILNYDLGTMMRFESNGQLSRGVLDAFKQVVEKQTALRLIEAGIGEIDRQTQEIVADQGRIRENMARIDSGSQLYARYVAKLTDQESRLEDLIERRRTEQQRLEQVRAAFDEFVRGLDVE